ncbi:MAG: motility associated factor glycosyltransferase family protein [Treponema sp.]|nr:motility associated factor glycosyltransferase family protein [Treponema sp.]
MINFAKAKNGADICIKDGFYLHSNYNPQKEAERFVETIKPDYMPSAIIVTEPALSYAIPFLKEKFPNSKFCAIRFCDSFNEFDNLWDKVFYLKNDNLQNQLFDYFGEELVNSLFFVSWKPSENAFTDCFFSAWQSIKSFITLSRDILGTRIYFNKRWNKNVIKFSIFLENAVDINFCKITKPIVIAASGPSLKHMLPTLKEHRNCFFLLAVSSALKPLLTQKILPDAVISTDGGWYAQEHLKQLKFFPDIPIFLSTESYSNNKMLKTQKIIPLSYKDGVEAILLEQAGIKALKAERNGTVSGTAAELALKLTDKDIFFCGLDLCTSNGFQHIQPNELELDKIPFDTKFSPVETRISLNTFENEQLKIYRNWFSTRPKEFSNRIKRVYQKDSQQRKSLPNISDITAETFEKIIQDSSKENFQQFQHHIDTKFQSLFSKKERIKKLELYFSNLKKNIYDFFSSKLLLENAPFELELWFKSLSLGDYLSLTQRNESMTEKMYENLKTAIYELEELLNRYEK